MRACVGLGSNLAHPRRQIARAVEALDRIPRTRVLALSPRRLLLHKAEIRKLFGLASVKGNALVPLSFYWKDGKVKVALGVGKGKVEFDKREDIKKRDVDREIKRAAMHRFKAK